MSGGAIFFDKKNFIRQTFSSSTTWIVPDGVTEIFVEAYGGGGGGDADTTGSGADGGGAGGRNFGLISVIPGENITVTIGSGGAGALSAASSYVFGQRGGNSSFKTVQAYGGIKSLATNDSTINDRALDGYVTGALGGASPAGANRGRGGDAGIGSGGAGGNLTAGSSGGTAAGGGGGTGGGDGGSGGPGIIYIYYKTN